MTFQKIEQKTFFRKVEAEMKSETPVFIYGVLLLMLQPVFCEFDK